MQGSQRPTMKNVAKLAGVSFKSVSRVINGEPGVSRQLEERVTAAIAELGYQPDHGARTLRRTTPQSATVGVVHANISNPFMAAVHAAFEAVAATHGCLILSGTSMEQRKRHDELVHAFTGRRVDGLLVVPVGTPADGPSEILEREITRGTPVVFVDRDPGFDADVVMSDHRGGAQLATRHLLEYGHRRIAFLGSRERVHSVTERRSGFENVMRNVAADPAAVITGLRTPDDAAKAVHELLSRPRAKQPTALFAAQNGLTLGAVRALHSLGLQQDIALVGFDDIDAVDIVDPGITTVPQNADEVGRRAGELLFNRLSGDQGPPMREIVPVPLVRRGSGEIPAPTT